MNIKSLLVTLIVSGIGLTGCSTSFMTQNRSANPGMQPTSAMNSVPPRTYVNNNMDTFDKEKLSHALDKGINKSTQWVNANTGITYTVTPTDRIVQNGDTYCRQYTMVTTKNDIDSNFSGKACVSSTDSNWQMIN